MTDSSLVTWRPPSPPGRYEMEDLADYEAAMWRAYSVKDRAAEEAKDRVSKKRYEQMRKGVQWASRKHKRALDDLFVGHRQLLTYRMWEEKNA